jgi:hypothetical protein
VTRPYSGNILGRFASIGRQISQNRLSGRFSVMESANEGLMQEFIGLEKQSLFASMNGFSTKLCGQGDRRSFYQ